jgi:dTDP-4-dehydrorhamnose reductase
VKKIAVLGSTGMIGSGIIQFFSDSEFTVTEFNRTGIPVDSKNSALKFNINEICLSNDFSALCGFDYVINLAGIIRHKIDLYKESDYEQTLVANSLFPIQLDRFAREKNFKVFQIGTDCVYSGEKGNYTETDPFDPTDLYGRSKVLGEVGLTNTYILRVSVVGREKQGISELMEWVLNQPLGAKMKGFSNHIWNGVTTWQLARILNFIILSEIKLEKVQHIVPSGCVSKFELVSMIARIGKRDDLDIIEFTTDQKVDRTLNTNYDTVNANIWMGAGYSEPPKIGDMLTEYLEKMNAFVTSQGEFNGR